MKNLDKRIKSEQARKVKYVDKIVDKQIYPTASPHYETAHRAANKAEKKANPKMFNQETKAQRKLKPGTLMADHDKKGNIKIEKQYKKFTPNLVKHEFVEKNKDAEICAKCGKGRSAH